VDAVRRRIAAIGLLAACATAGAPNETPQSALEFGVVAQTLLDSAASKYRRVAPMYDPANGAPRSTGPDGRWNFVPVADWTSGFYPGTLWYLHEYTLDPLLRVQAERFTMPIAAVTHGDYDDDLGFQFRSSFGNAYRVTRDERFRAPLHDAAWRDIARRHGLLAAATHADSSTWARGQAWGIYGFTMLYRETRDPRFLAAARRLTANVLPRLPEDFVPCWDYQAPGCPEHALRDASAAAIMASGLLELSTYVRGPDSVRYRGVAEHMLASLASPAYLAPNSASSLLLHSVGDRSRGTEVDVGIVYADYYFVEALLRYLQLSGQSGVRVLDVR
jgi:hypothetical protein